MLIPTARFIMLKFLQKILYILSRLILKKYRPKVIGITGSIGKTSTKDAVFAVLKNNFEVRCNKKNYNNEIGLPLTILGAESGRKSLLSWLLIFLKAIRLLISKSKEYPDILVLEMAADKSGDIEYLAKLAPPDIGIITNVSESHLEFFKTIKRTAKEKEKLVLSLPKTGYAVLNADDSIASAMQTPARIMTYGLSNKAKIRALEISVKMQEDFSCFLSFKIQYQGSITPVRVKGLISSFQVYPLLAAAAIGFIFKLNSVEIAEALSHYSLPLQRMQLKSGIKQSLIIDDTYNSSPASAQSALQALKEIKAQRRIAVLGDMFELGSYEEKGHREIGRFVSSVADILITVGEKSNSFLKDSALRSKLKKEQIYTCTDSQKAGELLKKIIKKGDVVLVKGSRGIKMERVVESVI